MDEETKAAMESGKPVMIFHINSVGQMNPSATTVNNHYWGDEFVPVEDADGKISGAVRRKDNKSKAEPKAKPERKSAVPKLKAQPAVEQPSEYMTFKKRGIQEAHVRLLYQKMIDLQWLSKDNNERDFLDLFSGELSGCKVVWGKKYGQSTLAFIFEYFESEGVIAVAQGYTIPNILKAHFVDEDGNVFNSLDKKDPAAPKSGPEAIELLNILKLNANRQGRRAARIDHSEDDDYSGYGTDINTYELEEEGLGYTNRP